MEKPSTHFLLTFYLIFLVRNESDIHYHMLAYAYYLNLIDFFLALGYIFLPHINSVRSFLFHIHNPRNMDHLHPYTKHHSLLIFDLDILYMKGFCILLQ